MTNSKFLPELKLMFVVVCQKKQQQHGAVLIGFFGDRLLLDQYVGHDFKVSQLQGTAKQIALIGMATCLA